VDEEFLKTLPGAEVVLIGLGDLRSGRDSVNASAVQSARSKLIRAGVPVPPVDRDEAPAAHLLYERLADEVGDGAHARYNALLARVDSFARAAEIARPR
jgi:hypothetical protein